MTLPRVAAGPEHRRRILVSPSGRLGVVLRPTAVTAQRRDAATLVALTLIAVMTLIATRAAAYPPARDDEARIDWQKAASSVGPWQLGEGELVFNGGERQLGALMVQPPRSPTMVRARFRGGADADLVLLYRVQDATEEALSGYAVAIDAAGGEIELFRWDHGAARRPGVAARGEWRGRSDLELVLFLAGAHVAVFLYDGLTKAQLAALSWSDASYVQGALGLRVRTKSPAAVQAAVSIVAEGAAPTPATGWLAPEWLVTMTPQTALALPKEVRAILAPTAGQLPGEAAFATTEAGAIALRELALSGVRRVQPGIPFSYRDPTFFARRAAAGAGRDVYAADGLKDPALVEHALRYYADRYPTLTSLETIGETAGGRPILALRISASPQDRERPSVLLFAAEHGDEPSAPEYPLDAARYLLEHRDDKTVRRWLEALAVVIVPLVNPDGAYVFWHETDQIGRKNQRPVHPSQGYSPGVDLNRNYPFLWNTAGAPYNSNVPSSPFYRGDKPASEPEVQAIMQLTLRERPVAAVCYHASAAKILVPYTIEGASDPAPSNAWAVAQALAPRLSHRFERRKYAVIRNLYPVDGTSQDWMHHALGTVALLAEVPYNAPVKPEQVKEGVEFSRPIWQVLLDRWLEGPSLSVRTLRAADRAPVAASLRFDEITLRAGEEWTSGDSGWLHYLLPAAGSYTVRARLGAGDEASTKVNAKTGVVRAELVVP